MAENKTPRKSGKSASIDAVYEKYTRSVIRTLASTEFYDFFMDVMSRAENEIQFSNRKCLKVVDPKWMESLEAALSGFQNIIANPRNIIREDEVIVPVAQAKRAGPDVVRHLAQHGHMVASYDYETHEVRPNKLMQKIRDDSTELYENRLVFTVLEASHHFVRIRYEALFNAMSDEYGVKLRMQSDLANVTEDVHFEMFMHIKQKDNALETDQKNGDMLGRVARLYRLLTMFMNTPFAQQMARLPRVHGAIIKTNLLKKHPDYKAIVKLWEILQGYDEVGYAIKVQEQSTAISDEFQRDLFHNVMFNYIVLKGYLEDDEDRKIPATLKERNRTLKPKVIRDIIEELTEDYDLPDVEVRKVLIEQLTKEQLMKEEEAERRRLVAEAERRRKEEEEQARLAAELEKDRIRQEKEAERERLRREKEAEEERQRLLRYEQDAEDYRFAKVVGKELDRFKNRLPDQLEKRRQDVEKQKKATTSDFADAVAEMEAAEQRRLERAEQERRRRAAEQERQLLAQQEAERLRQEELARQKAAQRKVDDEDNRSFVVELAYFAEQLPTARETRAAYLAQLAAERDQFEEERRQYRAQRQNTAG